MNIVRVVIVSLLIGLLGFLSASSLAGAQEADVTDDTAPWTRVFVGNYDCPGATPGWLPINGGPVAEDDCVVTPGSFTFTRIDDGSNAVAHLETVPDAENAIDLVPGTYNVVHDASGTAAEFIFPASEYTAISFYEGEPEAQQPAEWTRVFVGNYLCTDVATSGWIPMNDVPNLENCAELSGAVTFYLVGDGSADYEQIVTGTVVDNAIDLAPGTYEVVHEATQVKATFTFGDGQYTSIIFLQADSAETPVETATAAPTQAAKSTSTATVVTSLPSTGSGQGPTGAILLVSAAAIMLIAGASLTLRKQA